MVTQEELFLQGAFCIWTQCNHRAVVGGFVHMTLLMPIKISVNWIETVGFTSVWDRNCHNFLSQKGLRHLWCPSGFALRWAEGDGCQQRNLELSDFLLSLSFPWDDNDIVDAAAYLTAGNWKDYRKPISSEVTLCLVWEPMHMWLDFRGVILAPKWCHGCTGDHLYRTLVVLRGSELLHISISLPRAWWLALNSDSERFRA